MVHITAVPPLFDLHLTKCISRRSHVKTRWRNACLAPGRLRPTCFTPTSVILGFLCGRSIIGTGKLVLTTGTASFTIFRPIFRSGPLSLILSALSSNIILESVVRRPYDSFTHSTSLAPPPDLVYMTARTVQHEAHDEGTRDNLNDIVRTYISQRGPLILLYRSPS